MPPWVPLCAPTCAAVILAAPVPTAETSAFWNQESTPTLTRLRLEVDDKREAASQSCACRQSRQNQWGYA